MRESGLNLWAPDDDFAPNAKIARCITTNGDVNRFGDAVMGRGVAKQCAERYPHLQAKLGDLLKARGNNVHLLHYDPDIYTFPVKHHWNERADLELIRRSAGQLFIETMDYDLVILPRPGCGNGSLDWAVVQPVIEPILVGPKFVVVGW